MEIALFRCCPTSTLLKQYETSTNAILKKLDVPYADIKEFNCCGYPLKNIDFNSYVLSSARNLAIAEKKNKMILTVCNCCYGTMKHVKHILDNDHTLRKQINSKIEKENLFYSGEVQIEHLFEFLYKDIGLEKLKTYFSHTYKNLAIATHYGCHLLRPSQIINFDNPINPSKFDELVEVTGADAIEWPTKLDCCGAPVLGTNDELSMNLTERKIIDAKKSGADFLCLGCVYCHLQFDRVNNNILFEQGPDRALPSLLYTQLIGLCMGIDEKELGILQNQLDISGIVKYLN